MGLADVEGCCSLETTNTVGGREGLRVSFPRDRGLGDQAQSHSQALQKEGWTAWMHPRPRAGLGLFCSLLSLLGELLRDPEDLM